jgi:hypothetical protein
MSDAMIRGLTPPGFAKRRPRHQFLPVVGGAMLLFVVATTDSRCTWMAPSASGDFGQGRQRPATRGLVLYGGASPGFVLFSPLLSTTTYLVDRQGRVAHTWGSRRAPGASVYLLDNGHLLRCSRERDTPIFQAGGEGGRIQEFAWDGELVWDYLLASPFRVQHHDIEPLPNGNVLAIVWERIHRREALQLGRAPELLPNAGLLLDAILEIEPMPPTDGQIVWEWRVRDHLIQDRDSTGRNFGVVADHPERIDINGDHLRPQLTEQVMQRLKAIGYVSGDPSPDDLNADFLHTNAVDYNAELDQILISAHRFNEIWIIDHSTTSREAAGHIGGRAGKGGDLLYRWGNPVAYGRGTADDRQLFAHHDGRWIRRGFPGEGNILIFNNGWGRPGRDFSSVVEIVPPVTADGTYVISPESAFGPAGTEWTYTASQRSSFSADFISGAHRLANGNTFICSGPAGRIFEVTPAGTTVWDYLNPFTGNAANPAGDPPHSVFRATFIPADHPSVANRGLETLR